ncbi:WbqC family protein [Empedobacter falsenii]|uniref:WbqC family protein n=1 Tax=Empedobacter falsenii TaxID=343874 RepID=A0ABY8VB50_9FLAO|nr:WbqC family protein [Empedobacter falsenii]WIH98582.1 WbqC family protein [Empedobacter falsenii]
MRIAVMQPYIFPYIGYFQMIKAVDTFVFYDDVNFIKQGWINRNNILLGNNAHLFTVPLDSANSFVEIKETLINKQLYKDWREKFLKTLYQNYKKAPFFSETWKVLECVFNQDVNTISELAILSIKQIAHYLELKTNFKIASESYLNKDLERQSRLIAICHKEEAIHYINAIGGQSLYKKENFITQGIKLDFIKSKPIQYKQFNNDFVPWLSIIDILMFNSVEEVNVMLDQYELL